MWKKLASLKLSSADVLLVLLTLVALELLLRIRAADTNYTEVQNNTVSKSSFASASTPRHTESCPERYKELFCLNGGTCYVSIVDQAAHLIPMPFCFCTANFTGVRCDNWNSIRRMVIAPVVSMTNSGWTSVGAGVLALLAILVLIAAVCCLCKRHNNAVKVYADESAHWVPLGAFAVDEAPRAAAVEIVPHSNGNVSLDVSPISVYE